jgi:hypothetical protein
MTKASDNLFPKVTIRESLDDGSDFTNPSADYRVFFVGEDGDLHLKDSAGAVTDFPAGGGSGSVANVWTMNKSSSQTLTSNTLTQITFDTTVIDGGSSVIDLANDRFVVPATGFYLFQATWIWEGTAPTGSGAFIQISVGGTAAAPLIRPHVTPISASLSLNGSGALSLSSGGFVTMHCHPGGAVTPTARGNASVHLATTFSLIRIT